MNLKNVAKSLKVRKLGKIIKQAEKLLDFGSDQVFLFDICIVEPSSILDSDFSNSELGKMIEQRYNRLKGTDIGYVFAIEQSHNVGSNQSGSFNPYMNALSSKTQRRGVYFEKFVKKMSNLCVSYSDSNIPVIFYCIKCKEYYVISKSKLNEKHICKV